MVEKQVLDFILERARYVLKERSSLAHDEINAALAAGADDLVDAVRRAEAVKAIRKTKNFEPLAISFKRIRKILEKAGPNPAGSFRRYSLNFLRRKPNANCIHKRRPRRVWQSGTKGKAGIEKLCRILRGCVRPWTSFLTRSW